MTTANGGGFFRLNKVSPFQKQPSTFLNLISTPLPYSPAYFD
jgi:K+-transporting ATPase A subunit